MEEDEHGADPVPEEGEGSKMVSRNPMSCEESGSESQSATQQAWPVLPMEGIPGLIKH